MRRSAAAIAVLRVPNALTAAADVLAGFGAAGGALGGDAPRLACLLGASALLYAGGVALNDVVDAADDRVHRPERPIPSGAISRGAAAALAAACGGAGLALAAAAGAAPLRAALALSAAILAYDVALKRFGALGALDLGACRALNMSLGAALATGVAFAAPISTIAFGAYVAALALVGLGEERGAPRFAFAAGLAAMIAAAATAGGATPSPLVALLVLAPFLVPLAIRLARAAKRAGRPGAGDVRAVVREGVLAIPGIDCAILAGHSRFGAAALAFALFVAARVLARRLAVA